MTDAEFFAMKTLLRAMEQMLPTRTFLRDTFFNNTNSFTTETVDIDIVKGKRRLAPFVHPRIGSQTVDATGFSTRTYRPALVAPDYPFTGADLQKRLPGEHVYSGKTPDQRLAVMIGKKLREFDEMITRREEWMAAQALFEGKVNIKGEGIDDTLDFQFTNKETVVNKWNVAAGKPLEDLKKWKRKLVQLCGINPTHVILGSEAADAFTSNESVLKAFNLLKVNNGTIKPEQLANGVIYYGYLPEIGVDVYSYEEWFVDPTDQEEKPMVPAKKILMASTNADFRRLYGAIIDVNHGSFALPRVPKSWMQEKPSARFLQLSSAPVMAPVQVDSYLVADVL